MPVDDTAPPVRRRGAATDMLGPESQMALRLQRIEDKLDRVISIEAAQLVAIDRQGVWKMEALRLIARTAGDSCKIVAGSWRLQVGILVLAGVWLAGVYGLQGRLGDWLVIGLDSDSSEMGAVPMGVPELEPLP